MPSGADAEQRAADYLVARGLRVLARNWRCRGGELDLVMQEGDTVVFVEVRARSHDTFGGAKASITPTKQARVILAARHFLADRRLDAPCRFDAICIQRGQLEWLKNAFEAR